MRLVQELYPCCRWENVNSKRLSSFVVTQPSIGQAETWPGMCPILKSVFLSHCWTHVHVHTQPHCKCLLWSPLSSAGESSGRGPQAILINGTPSSGSSPNASLSRDTCPGLFSRHKSEPFTFSLLTVFISNLHVSIPSVLQLNRVLPQGPHLMSVLPTAPRKVSSQSGGRSCWGLGPVALTQQVQDPAPPGSLPGLLLAQPRLPFSDH